MDSDRDGKEFVEKHRWELAKAYQARADHSANTVRTILFTVCAAGIGFILQQQKEKLGLHILPLLTFGGAAAVVLLSWDLQKKKASENFKTLRDKGVNNYLAINQSRDWLEILGSVCSHFDWPGSFDRVSDTILCSGLRSRSFQA